MSWLRLLADRSYLVGTMPLIPILIALVLHFLSGWPIWVSVLVAGGGQTAIAILGHKLLRIPLLDPTWQIVAVALGGMLLSYVPMVLISNWTGHSSW
jgi:hypothetical protein